MNQILHGIKLDLLILLVGVGIHPTVVGWSKWINGGDWIILIATGIVGAVTTGIAQYYDEKRLNYRMMRRVTIMLIVAFSMLQLLSYPRTYIVT